MAMTKQLWSISAAAVELDKDRRTIAAALRNVPADGQIDARTKGWNPQTILAALRGDGGDGGEIDYQVEKARLTQAQADAQEMKNALLRRDLLARGDVDAAVEAAFARVRAKMLSVPSKVAAEAAAETDPVVVQSLVEAVIHEALGELALTGVDELVGDAD